MNKYKKIIDYINKLHVKRDDLSAIRINAQKAFNNGDLAALSVLEAVNKATPADKYFVFMGFCPGADFRNRLDTNWKNKGICTFDFYESERQMKRFQNIQVGDLIILKKIQERGKLMRLYGHGRVKGLEQSEKGDRMLRMHWSPQSIEIEVPLMACNDTVNIRTLEKVDAAMPDEFWKWLEI